MCTKQSAEIRKVANFFMNRSIDQDSNLILWLTLIRKKVNKLSNLGHGPISPTITSFQPYFFSFRQFTVGSLVGTVHKLRGLSLVHLTYYLKSCVSWDWKWLITLRWSRWSVVQFIIQRSSVLIPGEIVLGSKRGLGAFGRQNLCGLQSDPFFQFKYTPFMNSPTSNTLRKHKNKLVSFGTPRTASRRPKLITWN